MKHVKTRCLANRIRCASATLLVSATLFGQALHSAAAAPTVELLRDPWGIPHVFAAAEPDGFFGLGYAAAEDRLLQMELIRRKAAGRLAEVFGPDWVDADREARIAGHAAYAPRAFAKLPSRWQEALRAYAAGVNAWRETHPDAVARRFKALGIQPEPWTPSDCLLAARGVLSLGSPFNAGPIEDYHRFSELVAQVGEADALRQSGLVIDDSAAIVSESDMAKDAAVYQRLKQCPRMPGLNLRPAGGGEEGRKMSHAWAVSGRKSTTDKPILESDPQLPLSSPPFFYEFHLVAGKIDARGLGIPGCPGLFIGWNRRVAWGASALGVDSHVVFLDRLTPDGKGYLFEGKPVPFERRLERIEVKGGQPVIQEVFTSRHGTVFNSLVRSPRAGEASLLYDAQTMDDGASARMMLEVLDAGNWTEFRSALGHYYSPGLHIVYADVDGNVGYHTMVHRPLTARSPRRALEGWTGREEVLGRVPFDELPHLLNPESGYVSHANNLPVGSWYPYDLGLATGGTGHTSRSLRLQELLKGDRKFSVDDFERVIHRDDVNSIVATLLPIARKVVEEDRVSDAAVLGLLDGVKGWDMHEARAARFPAARGLGNTLTPYRGSGLNGLYGAGSGGVANLARAIGERFAAQATTPTNKLIRAYLVNWLRASANANGRNRDGATASDEWNARLAQGRPAARDAARTITIPYQRTIPLNLPVVDPSLDVVSPPLACLDTGTIWSQPGNIYSQIVDLADVDNSRSMIAPGNAEDSPCRTNQVDLWVRGTMHPAPLSRAKVEALGGKAQNLTAVAYSGSLSSPQKTVGEAPGEARFVPAIPPVAAETKSEAKPMPGRKPEDPTLEAAFRVMLRQGTPPEEVAAKVAECRDYVKGNPGLTDQLRNAALLGEYLIEESAAGRLKVQYGSPYVLENLKALLQDLGREPSSAPGQPAPARWKDRAESSGARLPTRTSVRIVEPLAYSQEAPSAQALSAYLVRSPNPAPVVVQVISGGWNSSPPRDANPEPFRPYLDAGLSVVTVAHRPVNETNHWPAPADDIARAIQFIRARATDWGIDPDRLAVKGRSSGGHVALMVGFGSDRAKPGSPDAVERQSSRPTCIIAGSAPTDLGLQMTELLKEENRPGLRREALRDGNGQDYLWERMCALLGIQRAGLTVDELARRLGPLSPVHVVTRDAPPVLLLHPGPSDAFWPGDARLKWDVHTPITGLILARRLKELGVPHELAMLPEVPEGRGGGVASPQELAFLQRHLQTGDSAQPLASKQALPASPAAKTTGEDDGIRRAELAKWDAADAHRSQKGPGGAEWDGQYRSFIQTSENAAAKGLPTHAEAARQIKEDAAKSREALAKHLGWVLFIKHFSQAYRPESATADLKRLYEDLVDLKLGGGSPSGGGAKSQERGKPGPPFDGDPRLNIHREVVYGRTHPEIQKLDAYLLKAERPTPVVIEIHGGGWRRGSKSEFTYPGDLVNDVLAAGISVVSIDYRLSPRHTMPAPMEDAARAVQFVRSKAREWNLDPNRIAALGGSAGAHLGAWVALHDDLARPDSADPVERQSSRLTCFVALWGPMDLTRVRPTQLAQQPLRGQDFANAFTAAFGCTAEQYEQDPVARQRIRDASPVFLAGSNDPPAFVMARWSEDLAVLRDPPVPAVINDPHSAWHSVLLAEALVKTGGAVVSRLGPEAGKDPQADAAAILSFLRQQLLSSSKQP